MTDNINAQKELIINKCLIIDDRFDEVKDIIFELNNSAISTDYREDVLDENVKIDPNIQLVILDLYMSKSQDTFDNALQSVAFLNENIKGPFFLLIWTKHKDKLNEFSKKLCDNYSNFENFPLDIEMLSTKKTIGEQNFDLVKETVNDIIKYINSIKNKYVNIYYYLKLTKIFQNQSTMFWNIFKYDDIKEKKEFEQFSKYYEDVLGQAFNSFDKSFNYEKSGKGFLNIHAKFLEHELTINPIDYVCGENKLDNRIKKEINSKLIIHSFNNSRPVEGLPGLIYKEHQVTIEKMLKEFSTIITLDNTKLSPIESFIYNFFKLGIYLKKNIKEDKNNKNQKEDKNNKNQLELLRKLLDTPTNKVTDLAYFDFPNSRLDKLSSDTDSILNKEFVYELKSKIEIGKLIITPYCDFAQEKKDDVLYLPILIIEDKFENRKKLFKNNVKFQDLHNGKYLAYIASMYSVCSLESLGNDTYSFYISKEYINEIQINVANNISRIGTTIID